MVHGPFYILFPVASKKTGHTAKFALMGATFGNKPPIMIGFKSLLMPNLKSQKNLTRKIAKDIMLSLLMVADTYSTRYFLIVDSNNMIPTKMLGTLDVGYLFKNM